MDFSLIILAGGKSSRMGTDKGLMPFINRPMISHVSEKMKGLFSETIIVSENKKYLCFCDKLVPDIHKGVGPLGGIEAGLLASKNSKNIILSCDNPLIETVVIEHLIKHHSSAQVIFSQNKKTHPFPGYYNQSIVQELNSLINEGVRKLSSLENHFELLKLDCSMFNSDNFINFNSQSDIKNYHESNR